MTLSGIEPETFRFVAQHLNHCATAVHLQVWYCDSIIRQLEGTQFLQLKCVGDYSISK